jgi:hypothetical protein
MISGSSNILPAIVVSKLIEPPRLATKSQEHWIIHINPSRTDVTQPLTIGYTHASVLHDSPRPSTQGITQLEGRGATASHPWADGAWLCRESLPGDTDVPRRTDATQWRPYLSLTSTLPSPSPASGRARGRWRRARSSHRWHDRRSDRASRGGRPACARHVRRASRALPCRNLR